MAELTDEQINAAAARLGFKEQHRGVLRDFARTILALSATGAEDAELRKKAARYDWLRSNYAPPSPYGDGWDRMDEAIANGGISMDIAIDAAIQSNGAAGGGEVSHGE